MAGRAENHLNHSDEEDAAKGNGARHRRVVGGPELRQARIAQRGECRREEMHEGRGDKDAGAEMADEEQERGRNAEAREVRGEDRKRTGQGGCAQDDEQSGNMQRSIVFGALDASTGARSPLGGSSVFRNRLCFWWCEATELTRKKKAEVILSAGTDAAVKDLQGLSRDMMLATQMTDNTHTPILLSFEKHTSGVQLRRHPLPIDLILFFRATGGPVSC